MNPTCDSNISWDLVIHVCRCGYGSWRVYFFVQTQRDHRQKKKRWGQTGKDEFNRFQFSRGKPTRSKLIDRVTNFKFHEVCLFFCFFLLSENSVRGETLSNQLVATPGERGHDFQLGIIFLLTGNRKQHKDKKKIRLTSCLA